MLKINDKIMIPEQEFELSYTRSSGPGGQNVNKVNSKAVLKWNVTESSALPQAVQQRFIDKFANRITQDGVFIISSDRCRDRPRNVEDCFNRLSDMIQEVLIPPKRRRPTKPSRNAVEKRIQEKKAQGEKKKQRQKPAM